VSAKSYQFSSGVISREVLDNYLSRAITQMDFLREGWGAADNAEDTRMLLNIGAKFIGRSIGVWSNFEILNRPDVWTKAKAKIEKMHEQDADMIFQAGIFEIVMDKINAIPAPAWVFEAYNLPVESRNFKYENMLNQGGYGVDFWAKGASIPDISRQETQMFFYYMACVYMETGIEAIHFGQVMLMAIEDQKHNYAGWRDVIGKVREAAKTKAYRGTILCDAHLSGIAINGQLLFDFVSYPLRPKEVLAEPQKATLEKSYIDAMYGRTIGGMTPSGWSCDRSLYLLEFDNNGISDHPNVADHKSNTVWGYDEISWFARQPEQYRNEFLEYAVSRIAEVDSLGHLQMPGSRNITNSATSTGTYRANTKSKTCASGQNQEETIKKIWSQ
jgi:hypothetical protein